MEFDLNEKNVFVAGHTGMVGSAVVRALHSEGCSVMTETRANLDLTDQAAVRHWINRKRPDVVVVCAARVGGIQANSTYPSEFLFENIMIATNLISSSYEAGVKKLLFLGSSCLYPKYTEQPIPESSLLTGSLEPTNEPYAIAKIAGIKLCQAYRRQYGCDFISAMPTSLFGPGDNFDLNNSHVIPALIRKTVDAKKNGEPAVSVWGTGKARREFLHVDDCASALVFLLKNYSEMEHVNIGTGLDHSILEIVKTIFEVVGYEGEVELDSSKPDGTPQKLLDISKIKGLGWKASFTLEQGISSAVDAFEQSVGRNI